MADQLSIDSARQPSPGLTTNLPSNNPFRNRTASPANSLPSPVNAGFNLQPTSAPERPTSRNPFLDNSEKIEASAIRVRSASPPKPSMDRSTKPTYSSHAEELFVSYTVSFASQIGHNANAIILKGQPCHQR